MQFQGPTLIGASVPLTLKFLNDAMNYWGQEITMEGRTESGF